MLSTVSFVNEGADVFLTKMAAIAVTATRDALDQAAMLSGAPHQ